MINKTGVALVFFLGASVADSQQFELVRAGALVCQTKAADAQQENAETLLSCAFRLDGDAVQQEYAGKMSGHGLHLIEPGGVDAIWGVLAMTRELDPKALAGRYDRNAKHEFRRSGRTDILFGGDRDAIGLELVTPLLGPLSPDTVLELELAK